MNLSIRAKLAGILALQMIAMALLGWQGIVGIRDLKDRVKLIYAGEFLPSRMIATTDSTLVSWNRAILNHILAENMEKMEQYEQLIKRTKETVSGTLGSLLGTVSLSQREKEIVRTIQEELARADPIQNHLLELSREGRPEEAQEVLHTELRPLVDEMDAQVASFLSLQEDQILESQRAIEERYQIDVKRIFLIIGSIFVVSLLINLFLSRAIAGSIRQLVKGAREFGRGNLDYRVEVKSGDEIEELASALNFMAAERRTAEDSLRGSTEKLKLFAYSVVHDLKSPAIGIHGLTGLLHKRYRDVLGHQGEKLSAQIMKASEQVVALVEKVNIYIATKEMPLNVEEINSREIFQMAKEEFSTQLSIRQIDFSWPEIEPSVRADRLSLLRVFRNLLDNALKYGGEQLSEIRIRYEESQDFHVFSVCDNGVGVKTDDPEKLFALFQRHETSKGVAGTGLGLAIVKEIVERHQGKVWAEPRSQGVSFFVTISKNL